MAPADLPSESRIGLYYALRCAVATAAACLLSPLFPQNHGLWMLIAAIVVVQPDPSATRERGVARLVGTVIGALIGTGAAVLLPFNALTASMTVLTTVVACWCVPALRGPIPMAALTAALVFSIDREQQTLRFGLDRTVQILCGVAIGIGVSLVPLPGEGGKRAG